MKFSVLFAVGANFVRPRAFTEHPYEDDYLSVGKTCFMEGTPCGVLFALERNFHPRIQSLARTANPSQTKVCLPLIKGQNTRLLHQERFYLNPNRVAFSITIIKYIFVKGNAGVIFDFERPNTVFFGVVEAASSSLVCGKPQDSSMHSDQKSVRI